MLNTNIETKGLKDVRVDHNSDTAHSDILGRVVVSSKEWVQYTAQTGREFFLDIHQKQLNHIRLKLTDAKNRPIGRSTSSINPNTATGSGNAQSTLGNLSFSAVIRFDIIKKRTVDHLETEHYKPTVPARFSNGVTSQQRFRGRSRLRGLYRSRGRVAEASRVWVPNYSAGEYCAGCPHKEGCFSNPNITPKLPDEILTDHAKYGTTASWRDARKPRKASAPRPGAPSHGQTAPRQEASRGRGRGGGKGARGGGGGKGGGKGGRGGGEKEFTGVAGAVGEPADHVGEDCFDFSEGLVDHAVRLRPYLIGRGPQPHGHHVAPHAPQAGA